MRRRTIPSLLAVLFLSTSGFAQSSGKPAGSGAVTDIRTVDFRNFTYRTTACSQEYRKQGIGKDVKVRDGEFKNRNVYFAVEEGKTLFGDLTGDGSDDAVVQVGCGAVTANFSLAEFFIYTIKDGRVALLADISDKTMEKDLRRHYPETESYWGLAGSDSKLEGGNLQIEVASDGPHAQPQYVTTLKYHWDGKGFQLIGKPERRNS